MKVKKFSGTSMQDVMNKIRLEFGQEAVILNSKVVTSNGILGLFKKKTFEVVATIDSDSTDSKKVTFTKVNMDKNPPLKRDSIGQSREVIHVKEDSKDPSQEILNELHEMKKWLSNESKYSLFPEALKEMHQKLVTIELNHHITDKLMDHLLEKWRNNSRSAELSKEELSDLVYAYLLDQVKDYSVQDKQLFQKKYINIIGPTGVGKTTTIAKIAAEYVMKHNKKIAFITTDTYRIAAIEQLKTYAEILRIPVEVAYNSDDFRQAAPVSYTHLTLPTMAVV